MGGKLEATNSANYVYAFLRNPLVWLGRDKDNPGVLVAEPDYSKDSMDVFLEVAIKMLEGPIDASHVLSFLSNKDENDLANDDFPS